MPDRSVHPPITDEDFEVLYRAGGRRLAPGIWIDRFGEPRVSMPELLAGLALEDSPANRAQVEANVRELLGDRWHPRSERRLADPAVVNHVLANTDFWLRLAGSVDALELEGFLEGFLTAMVIVDVEFRRRFPAAHAAWLAKA